MITVALDNPYWDAVRNRVDPKGSLWGTPTVDGYKSTYIDDFRRAYEAGVDRHSLVKRFSWTITDPETLAFVAEHSSDRLVDPMAGTGYWGWLLDQMGIDVASYDILPGTNSYHGGQPLYCTVERLDGPDAAALHADRTLFLSWPPMNDAGTRILRAYKGERVIYIGETEYGCCGDDDLFAAFERDWVKVAERVPVQWNGIHDVVHVYNRRQS